MFNRERGRHLEYDDGFIEASTTILSDADTAVPELVAAAAVGHGPTLQVEGKVFRGVVRPAGTPPHATDLATPAVLSGTHMDDPLGGDSAETPGASGTQLLPDTATAYHRQFTHGRLMLEEVTQHHGPDPTSSRRQRAYRSWLRDRLGHLPWRVFVSREVTAVFGVLGAAVVLLAAVTALVEDGPLWKSVYLPLLDILTMGDPATEESTARQVLQLVAGFVGLAVLPLVVAAAMNATLAFRTASANHVPDTALRDHIALVGPGKIGTRALGQLCTTDHTVVVIERDPQARGVALARELGVPCCSKTPPYPGSSTSPA
ncbi:hypothetical protein [Streptomyces sp. NBC_01244]|uniref:hypothetical protein n=1 Tax=Streptomyces sp. NBC_01244 TaxID=2903797 RepID=UPI002E0F0743|nr:hypothetical protein OG247_37585 [Streptomyces sp. NBC_01244]